MPSPQEHLMNDIVSHGGHKKNFEVKIFGGGLIQAGQADIGGKNIAFVSISVDKASDHNKWKQTIEENEMGGIQLFADKAAESDFITEYFIKNIPRYILIDPNGNIISSKAPKPSDDKLIDLFNEFNI